jgi:hypothetical protein
MSGNDGAGDAGAKVALSAVLRDLPGRFASDEATVDELIDALSPRSFPLIMLVLAFPNLVPVPAPGLSMLLGLPLAVLTFEMMLGYRTPVLPGFLARRRISLRLLTSACQRAAPQVERIEARIRPRLVVLLHPPADRLISLVVTLLALIILLPVPFGNALPALAICLIALGLLRGDGLTVLVGLAVAVAGLAFIVLFAGTLAALALRLLGG